MRLCAALVLLAQVHAVAETPAEAEESREEIIASQHRRNVVVAHGREGDKEIFMGTSLDGLSFTMLNAGNAVLSSPPQPCADSLYSARCGDVADNQLGQPFLARMEHYPYEEPSSMRTHFGLLTADSLNPKMLRRNTLSLDQDRVTAEWHDHTPIDLSRTFDVAREIAARENIPQLHTSLFNRGKWREWCGHPGFLWLPSRESYLVWWTSPTALASNGPRLWGAFSHNLTRLDSDPWLLLASEFSIGPSTMFHAEEGRAPLYDGASHDVLLFFTDENGAAGETLVAGGAGRGSQVRMSRATLAPMDAQFAPIRFAYEAGAAARATAPRFSSGARIVASGAAAEDLQLNGGAWNAVISEPYLMYYACGTDGVKGSFSGAFGVSQSTDLLAWCVLYFFCLLISFLLLIYSFVDSILLFTLFFCRSPLHPPGKHSCGQAHSVDTSALSFDNVAPPLVARNRWVSFVRVTDDELAAIEYAFPTNAERAETVLGILMTATALLLVVGFLAALCFVRLLGGVCCSRSGSLVSMQLYQAVSDVRYATPRSASTRQPLRRSAAP
jgi:hypothetical protein